MNTINTNLAYRDEYLYENVIENEGVQEIATTTDLARIDKENKVVSFSQKEIIKLVIYLKLNRDEIHKIFIDYENNKQLFDNKSLETIKAELNSKI